jgi:hypothetical protein
LNDKNDLNPDEREALAAISADFNRKMAAGVAVSGAILIPLGLLLCGVYAGWKGLLGSFVGFVLASMNAAAAMWLLKWALSKPADVMPIVLMGTMWPRLIAVAAILYGLTYHVHAFNTTALLASFLALFVAYTILEAVFAYKAFGLIMRGGTIVRR